MAKLPEDGNAQLFRFVAQVTKQAAATRVDQGCNLRPVTGNLHYFVNSNNNAMVGVIVQSNALGSNPFELVALAAYRATRDHPDAFGRIDDWDKHHAAPEEKHARLNELYAQISEAWKGAPIEWDGVNPQILYGDVWCLLPRQTRWVSGFASCWLDRRARGVSFSLTAQRVACPRRGLIFPRCLGAH